MNLLLCGGEGGFLGINVLTLVEPRHHCAPWAARPSDSSRSWRAGVSPPPPPAPQDYISHPPPACPRTDEIEPQDTVAACPCPSPWHGWGAGSLEPDPKSLCEPEYKSRAMVGAYVSWNTEPGHSGTERTLQFVFGRANGQSTEICLVHGKLF